MLSPGWRHHSDGRSGSAVAPHPRNCEYWATAEPARFWACSLRSACRCRRRARRFRSTAIGSAIPEGYLNLVMAASTFCSRALAELPMVRGGWLPSRSGHRQLADVRRAEEAVRPVRSEVAGQGHLAGALRYHAGEAMAVHDRLTSRV